MLPLITIITAVRNEEKHVAQTIESVLFQSYKHVQYIVVEGGSEDNTLDIIHRYKDSITDIIIEKQKGISRAFNKGLEYAQGEWIFFLNAGDCFLSDNVISDFVELASNIKKEISLVSGYVSNNNFLMPSKPLRNDMNIFHKSGLAHQATFFRKNFFDLYGGFDGRFKLRMDYDFLLRILRYEKFYFWDYKVCFYSLSGASSKRLLLSIYEGLKADRKNFGIIGMLNKICRVDYIGYVRHILRLAKCSIDR